ncbi:MAG: AbrB/MazE/SpoVT family DNA-binding domain-containing protein [Candidatus Sericytochromatia bacterium]|nr:AbrB/MazE/SpoVT family DNA-binding domain-containing protein [Candidatus Sericytochromatia bacterium]
METSRLSSKGQVTIPQPVRQAIGLRPGDLVGYEVRDGIVTLTRIEPFDGAFHASVSQTLGEWASPADEAAFRDL